MTERPRVLLADDDDQLLIATSRLLAPTCDVIGCACDAATLLEDVVRLEPEVVVVDFNLPGGRNVIEICRQLHGVAPITKIVIFTADDDAELRQLAHEAGAAGFVWKLEAGRKLVQTIHTVAGK